MRQRKIICDAERRHSREGQLPWRADFPLSLISRGRLKISGSRFERTVDRVNNRRHLEYPRGKEQKPNLPNYSTR